MVVIFGLAIILIGVPLLAMWTGRNLDFWLTLYKGHAVHVPFWMDLVVAVVLNAVIIGLNIIAEIARLLI